MSKLSEREEIFCQNVAKGMSYAEAYEAAGYSGTSKNSIYANAARLIRKDRVMIRVNELQGKAAQEAQIDLEWLIRESVATYTAAKKDCAYAAAVSALKEIGILTGVRVEKQDRTNRNVDEASELTRDELYRIARGSGQRTVTQGLGQRQLN